MQASTPVNGPDEWQRAAEWERLASAGRLTIRVDGKQLALFLHEGRVHACNNRCPHEGYPLVEGSIDGECMLTCHWHNWKFDLATGANQYGGDALRIYPVKVEAGAVWVDARDPPPEARIALAHQQLADAMADNDAPRIARELARLGKAGATPERVLTSVLLHSHDRFRYGMTHAYGAAESWLRLRDSLTNEAQRLACAAEVFGHIAHDTLREPVFAFSAQCRAWNAAEFEAAVEAQDEALATSLLNDVLLNGALLADAAGRSLPFADLEPSLRRAALAHFNDFGHSLIYLTHLRGLIHRLGHEAMRPLLLAWLRGLVFATREDLLPDFRAYGPALSAWPATLSVAVAGARSQVQAQAAEVSAAAFAGHSVRDTLAAVVAAAATTAPLRIHHALMEAAALHLLRFDEGVEQRADNLVADNVGWLDFTHAITFGQAVRVHCSAAPELWPQGLLQLAMFVGRNSGYLSDATTAPATLQRWAVPDAAAFDAQCIARVLDHGLAEHIYPAHLLKTWTAMRDELALGVPEATAQALRAAVNRLFCARFKQRHVMRTARQALGFVGRED